MKKGTKKEKKNDKWTVWQCFRFTMFVHLGICDVIMSRNTYAMRQHMQIFIHEKTKGLSTEALCGHTYFKANNSFFVVFLFFVFFIFLLFAFCSV